MSVEKELLILWVDLRYTKSVLSVESLLSDELSRYIITDSSDINDVVEKNNPDIICFDFDLPDQLGLAVIRDTKRNYPSLPFIMLTDDHSTELAIWALRSRAWDYFVKPVKSEELSFSIDSLKAKLAIKSGLKRNNFMPEPEIPSESRPYKAKSNSVSTVCAVDFVRQNLASKITVENVANRCGMSKSHFSRTFKKEHAITFQDFLIQQRMNKAVELLKNTDFHVTQIAFAVGYCELSNFTTTFQRSIGIGPSSFRKALLSKQLESGLM